MLESNTVRKINTQNNKTMKVDKKYLAGTAALALVLVGGATTASAYQGDYNAEGPNCTDERHEAMEAAFDDLDYDAWYELMDGKGRVTEVITEDNFATFAEAHELGKAGNSEGANKLRAELGLRGNDGERTGAGYMNGTGEGRGEGQGSRDGSGQGRGNR